MSGVDIMRKAVIFLGTVEQRNTRATPQYNGRSLQPSSLAISTISW